jgi:hypothetical protein
MVKSKKERIEYFLSFSFLEQKYRAAIAIDVRKVICVEERNKKIKNRKVLNSHCNT